MVEYRCSGCGANVPSQAKFCPMCGASIIKKCSQCGSAIIENAQFCSNCGAAVQETAAAVDPIKMVASKVNSATLDEERAFRLFIGENADYYLGKWTTPDGKLQKKLSWNWAAFFFGILWFFYRKMYGWALGFYVIGIALYFLLPGISFGMWIVYGLTANSLYYDHVKDRIETSRQMVTGIEDQEKAIAMSGGTSTLGVVAGIALICLFIVLAVIQYL